MELVAKPASATATNPKSDSIYKRFEGISKRFKAVVYMVFLSDSIYIFRSENNPKTDCLRGVFFASPSLRVFMLVFLFVYFVRFEKYELNTI